MELLDYINEEQDLNINESVGDLKALRAELKKHKITPKMLGVRNGGTHRYAKTRLYIKDITVNIHNVYDAIESSDFWSYEIESDTESIQKSLDKNPILGDLVEILYSGLVQKKENSVVFYKKGAVSIKLNRDKIELKSNQRDLYSGYINDDKKSFVTLDFSSIKINVSSKEFLRGRIGYDLVKSGILPKLDQKTLKTSLESVKRGETVTSDDQEILKVEELTKYVLNKFRAKYKDLDAKIEMYDEKTIYVTIDNLNYMPELLIPELGVFVDKCIQTVSKEKNISIDYIDNNLEVDVRLSDKYYRFFGADSKIFNNVVYNIYMASKIEEKLKNRTKITPINIYSDGANRIDLGFGVSDEYSAGYDQYYTEESMFFNIKSSKALTDKDGVKKKELTLVTRSMPSSNSYISLDKYNIYEITTLLKVMGFDFKTNKLVSVDGSNYKRAVIRAENETDIKPSDFYVPTQIHKVLRERFKGRLDVFEDSYKVFIDVYDKTLTNDEISNALEEIEDQVFDDIEKTYGIPKKELVSYVNDADYRVRQKENPNKKAPVTTGDNINQNIQADTKPKDRASTIESIKNQILTKFKNTVTSEDGQTYKVTIPQTHPYDIVTMFGEEWKQSEYRNERQPNINVVYDNSLIQMYNSDPTFIKLKEKILKESKFETSIPQMIYEDSYGNSIEFEYTGYESGILNFYSKSIRDMNIGTKETYQGIDVVVRQDGITTDDGTYSLAEIIMLTLFPIYDGGVID